MHFDFAAFLVLATLISGLVWLVDAVWLGKSRRASNQNIGQDDDAYRKEPVWVEYSRSFFPVLLLVLVLRSFLFEPFKIPSGSMMPTLLVGDFILVNKYAYGVRLPVWEKEILDAGKPERGEVAVFRYPQDQSLDYIKRVIGLPGDKIEYRNRTLYINGEKIHKKPLGEYDGEDAELMRPPIFSQQEKVGDHIFTTLEQPMHFSVEGELTVPDGHYFVMGDNRDNSNDSRVWGFVPVGNLVGRAEYIWMSWDSEDTRVRFDRIGTAIE